MSMLVDDPDDDAAFLAMCTAGYSLREIEAPTACFRPRADAYLPL
jgi:hypothetical protein